MRRVFRFLFGWLLNRWVISFIGVLLLCLLIWFIAPHIAFAGWAPLESVDARLATILIIFLIWLAKLIWATVRAIRTNARVVDGLAGQSLESPEDLASEEELAALRERFRESLAILKKVKLGGRGGRRHLYQLPWYLIIGPPGAGKTTSLKNSGLKFPLMDRFGQNAIQGVGGTRNCDWWFTDEAVLLDTAGRYTTQDSDQAVDSAAWGGFLQLLRKHRRRRPIDGVIIAFSLVELTQQRAEERHLHADAVRKRLQELSDDLKVKVPVYLIFTKCDLVAGFVEFFDDLSRSERGQIWGCTFPIAVSERPEGVVEAFGTEFDALMNRLDSHLIGRLDQERDVRRRGALHGFVQHMASFRRPLQDFLERALQPTRFEEPCLVRGVYFSSGTQEGTPIDRIIGSVSATFGLDRQTMPAFSGPGRSYFLTRLLRDVVFQEANLVGRTGLFQEYRHWFQRAAYAGAVLIVAGMVAVWTTSYLRNLNYIAEVETRIADYEQKAEALVNGTGSVAEMLEPLNALRAVPGGYDDREESAPFLMGFGLYQGDKLGQAARSAYRRALQTILLPRVARGLEAQMTASAGRSDVLYESLKAYLMLGNPQLLDRKFVHLWVSLEWGSRPQLVGAANSARREQFQNHLAALLEGELIPPPLDGALVEQARAILARSPLAERAYSQIRGEAMADSAKFWRVTDKIGDGARYFRRKSGQKLSTGIPGLFTYDGYTGEMLLALPEVARRASSESWVIGPEYSEVAGETEAPQLGRRVLELYFAEYITYWDDLLSDLDFVKFQNGSEAIAALNVLSSPESPLKTLLIAISEETTLTRSPVDLELGSAVPGNLLKLQQRLEKILGAAPAAEEMLQKQDPSRVVDQHFQALHDLVKGSAESPAPINHVIGLLNELYVQLNLDRGSGDTPTSPQLEAAIANIELDAQRRPQLLSGWLRSLATGVSDLKRGNTLAYLNKSWRSGAGAHCRQALSNRYPMA